MMTNPDRGPRLFDVRPLIAAILGIYGIILTVMGIGASAQSLAKADGIRINLWVGLAMLVVAGLFLWWSRTRPLVDESDETDSEVPD